MTKPDDPKKTEPSKRAVALAYGEKDHAPRVVAKGYGVLAETIMRTAREHGLYVHESPELVQLLMQVDLDERIPPQLYVAIAELLAWIYAVENSVTGSQPSTEDETVALKVDEK